MIQCASCEYTNRDGAKFCKNCGTSLAQSVTETTAEPDQDASHAMGTDDVAPAHHISATAKQPTTQTTGGGTHDDSMMQAQAAVRENATATADPQATPAQQAAPEPTPAMASAGDAGVSVMPPAPGGAPAESTPIGGPSPSHATSAEVPVNAVASSSPVEPASSSALQPPVGTLSLGIGDMIASRYQVTASIPDESGAVVYEVEDHGVCPSCGTTVSPTADEHYCFECGAHLFDTPQPRPAVRLRPLPADATPAADPFVVWNGYAFEALPGTEKAPEPIEPFAHGVNLLAGQRSDVGLMRADSPDEDSVFSLTLSGIYESSARPTVGLYVVADGMGGHGDGEVASRIAVETISSHLLQTLILPALRNGALEGKTITSQIDESIQLANHRIVEHAKANRTDMGTTITLAFVINKMAYIANVGDSRTYLWNAQGLRQITEDHSVVYQLVKNGALNESDIYTHPRRSEILRSLGIDARMKVDQFQVELAPENWLLLCCDGLWEMVHNDGIEDVLLQGLSDPQQLCDEFIRRANGAGGEDNISVLAVRIVD